MYIVKPKLDLSPRSRGRVVLGTIGGTLFCIAVALLVDSFNFARLYAAALERAILINVLVPTVLAAPLLLFFLIKLRQLAISQHELQIIASTDLLTGLFNRRAFVDVTEAYLASQQQVAANAGGALLVVDADDFKAINDRFGHEIGDEALKLLAGAIRATLRQTDLVGRIGGEEFGILLPGSSAEQSAIAAERLRRAISDIYFAPQGQRHTLSISIGGVTFKGGQSFSELFRRADEQLYAAKRNGRNRVAVSPAEAPAGPLAA